MSSFSLIFLPIPPILGTTSFYKRLTNITKSLKSIPYVDSQATPVMDNVIATTCYSIPPFSPTSSTSTLCHCFSQTCPVSPPGTTTDTWQPHCAKWHGVYVEAENRAVLPGLLIPCIEYLVEKILWAFTLFPLSPGPRQESIYHWA